MSNANTPKLKVIFDSNTATVDEAVSNALMVQLMVTVSQVGLRIDKLAKNDAIIEKEPE